MTDICTVIRAPKNSGCQNTLADRGLATKEHMIKMYRDYHAARLAEAEKALALTDDDFEIEIVRGVIVQRHVSWVQPPKKAIAGGKVG